jgi:CHAT domain-containing protein/tetratricopeptide (TPR) repeat protein
MHRYFPGILALCGVMSVALIWAVGTARAEDPKDQALYREAARAVDRKEWDRAFAAVDRWLAWRTRHDGARSKETGEAYRYRGEVFAKTGHHAKAIEAFRQALAIFSVDPGPRSEEVGSLFTAIADAYQAQGQGGEAIASLREALEIFEINPGPEAAVTATCLSKLALLLLHRGAFAEAESPMRQALRIREKLYPGQAHPDVAASLGNLGLLYFQMGAYEEAEEPLNRALEILDRLAGQDARYLLGASNVRRTLAALYAAQGNSSEAESLLQRVVADISKRFGNDSVEAAEAMAALAGFQLDAKRFKKAESWFTNALKIQSRKLPAGHEAILRTRNSLAMCFQYQGKYARARQTLERVLTVCRETLGGDHPLTIAVTHNLGMTLVTLGENTRAREHTQAFLKLLSDNLERVLAYFPENRRLGFVRNMGFSPYDLAATLGDGPLTADAVLTFKGAVLESMARDRRRALLARGSDSAKLVEQIDGLREQFLEAQLAGDAQRTRNLAAGLEEKERELSRDLREGGTYRPLQQVAWGGVASRLPVGAVLLEFVFYNKHLGGNGGWRGWCGAVALARNREPIFKELGPSDEILKSIDSYLDIAAGKPPRIAYQIYSDAPAHLNVTTETACRDLFDRLLSPFADVMPRDGAQLFICPDGRLSFVSFATLLDHDDKFIGSRFQVCYVDSGRVFLEQSEPQEAPSHRIALLGNPDFESSDAGTEVYPALQMASRGINEEELRAGVNRDFSRLAATCFESLSGSAEEVEAIAAVFRQNGWQTQLLCGGEATETKFRAVVPGASLIHLATHGCFMDEFNATSEARISDPMFRGWLALAGANATLRAWSNGQVPPPASDGILMAAELTGLDLSAAELVVFSACDTVKGEPRNGEGILGLRRGVALAGAKTLLLTSWKIHDRYTVEFMKLLYAAILAGDGPAAALHKVQARELTTLREQHGTFLAVHRAGPFLITSLRN